MTHRTDITTPTDDLSVYTEGVAGVIDLDRPRALNSLTHPMVTGIADALAAWRDDPTVTTVLIRSTSPKAFCAGGDVRWAAGRDADDDHATPDAFFREEYDLNATLAEYPKPVVALIDGLVMGGGLGISAHGSHRVVTPSAWASMPEMAIGFVTDVGMTHVLSHLRHAGVDGVAPGPSPALALFLAVTGYRQSAEEMLWSGLATHLVPEGTAEQVADRVIAEGVDAALADARTAAGAGVGSGSGSGSGSGPGAGGGDVPLAAHLGWIGETFGSGEWAEVAARIDAATGPFADEVRSLLAPANPTSLVATTELVRRSARSTLRGALDAEYAVGCALRRQPNFVEGVRAVLVDKDHEPSFRPADVADVDPAVWRDLLA
ncbi:3-hydroxyisobutyryl-CoA hydrolase [Corynebacterium bovis]|uniref:3-hydroxyisobutyryl-CoA hydrolase n=2 Tax=Corynebacterium bovis TaxID=36808 RepID=UPI000F62C63B|nr:3-hydroxyisobutyryl-CoA hydrolase [Corynebacterium bovis]RRQ06607.1 hypothetical protein CXF43_07680 [Corynebacterium bovis]RRQ10912.1 hypothetical protein CXF44_02415 [Corynebacterium bovis]RRQ12024.1 hypothetical protein CXF34_02730 [Corynebacterium bovis]RRQ15207.1 hypothetical protein CXF35_05720 [Corynebacterium bovis]